MRTLKRAAVSLAMAGILVYGIGGCGLRRIGAGLLSEFLTTGDIGSLGSSITSGLDSILGQFAGLAT